MIMNLKEENVDKKLIIDWDWSTPLYSTRLKEYLKSYSELVFVMRKNDISNVNDLGLVVCKRNAAIELSVGYWREQMKSFYASEKLLRLIDDINAEVKEYHPGKWNPTNIRVIVQD